MKTNASVAKRIVAATVVATGIGIAWAIVVGWCLLISHTLVPIRSSLNELLMVASDGTPVIATTRVTGNVSVSVDQRTLDGKPLTIKKNDWRNWLGSDYFRQPYEPPGLVDLPLRWNEGEGRAAGVPDGKIPPTGWWFVRDNEQTGGVYVAGYDGISKLPIGYIGRSGFGSSKPIESEQFLVPRSKSEDGFRGLLESNHYPATRRLIYNYDTFSPNRVFLLGTDQLWEIDLQERTVQSWLHFDDALSMGSVRVTKATFDGIPIQIAKSKSELAKTLPENAKKEALKEASDGTSDEGPDFRMFKAVRQRDRLVFFDLWTGKLKAFVLPESLRTRRMSVWLLTADQILVDAHEQEPDEFWSGGPIVRLYWIDPAGKIEREREVRLAGVTPATPRALARSMGVFAPVPIGWLVGTAVGAPLYLLQSNHKADFGEAFAYFADVAWPPLVAVLIVGIVLAWLTLRLQRKYRRAGTAPWTVFVGLFGVPGFLAYLVENRRTKLEACPQCGEIVPRDRDACAACNTEFAAPAPVGTEIFA
jgi:hypothetical protein